MKSLKPLFGYFMVWYHISLIAWICSTYRSIWELLLIVFNFLCLLLWIAVFRFDMKQNATK